MKGRISSRGVQQGSTLPEIGRIKVGEKSQRGLPTSLDYFRATGDFANRFHNLFGEKPTELHVAFVSNDLSEVCNEQFEAWEKGKRWGYGNGETFTIWDATGGADRKGGYIADVPKDDPRVKAIKGWARTLTLRFVLLEMKGILGYWTFSTKAKETTIPSIVKAFDMVMERSGSIIGFPFSLMVKKVQSYSPGMAKNYPIVQLVPNFTEETIEAVRAYVESGADLNRLTTNMITSGSLLQLGSGSANGANAVEDVEPEEVK
ncbi:hypothetical protein M8998_07420 [Sphingobacterium sp. lm-10]|uniref:recombination directionality factor n=1 Tax=Sphingobacterium sp. lm-10 TaxID=2944904 RepID=UPI002021CDDA|nr:hypothetical protein [Sphingobacterium sp. lm-10]MCL7987764.1 hypothetical protein [Sphingobacterium sp. lm-10]